MAGLLLPDVQVDLLTILLGGLLITLLLRYLFGTKTDKYPPGPLGLPIVGNIPQIFLSGSLVNFCKQYRKIFGNVFTLQLGGHKRVVLSGYDNLYKVLIKNADHSSGRSAKSICRLAEEMAEKSPGVFWAPFPDWKKMRSLAISALRDEGMGKARMEPQIMEEIESFAEYFIEPNIGKAIDLSGGLQLASSNLISQMIFGKRYPYDDETARAVVRTVSDSFTVIAKLGLLSNVPFAGYFRRSLEDKINHYQFKVLQPFCNRHAEDRKACFDADNICGVIDQCILQRMKATTTEDERCFAAENCRAFSSQLYSAGTETTSTALAWGLLFMCLHPEVLRKVQEEIDEQIGAGRPVTSKDRLAMPYTDAVLLEILRKANIVPTAVPHTVDDDIEVEGKIIPAGADVLLNMASVLSDETVFEKPDKFMPERYLMGDVALKKQRTIPFGIGRRACLGESLAKMELFMFFVTFLQRYNVNLPEGSTVTDEPVLRFVNSPKPYEIIFTRR